MYQASAYSDDFDPSLALFEGSCDGTSCVYNADHWGSGVSWESERGKEYMVVVHACCGSSAVGEYVLQLAASEPPTPTISPLPRVEESEDDVAEDVAVSL